MTILPNIYQTSLAFAAVLACMGLGLFFLRRVTIGENSPGYWMASYFFSSAGFLFWAGTATSHPWMFYSVGEVLQMLGFFSLTIGACLLIKNEMPRRYMYALSGLAVIWLGAVGLMPYHRMIALSLHIVMRSILFLSAGYLVLKDKSAISLAGRGLVGWSLVIWGLYIPLFPLFMRLPMLSSMTIGFFIGLHVMSTMGMVVLVMMRIRQRAEEIEKHAQRLEDLLPICSYCKKIRDDSGKWNQIEYYIHERSGTEFSHGICPECAHEHFPDLKIFKDKDDQKTI